MNIPEAIEKTQELIRGLEQHYGERPHNDLSMIIIRLENTLFWLKRYQQHTQDKATK